MTYKLVVDFSPVYELISSFELFAGRKFIRNTDLGNEWVTKVKKQLKPEFLNLIANPKELPCMEKPFILVWKSPCKHNIKEFLQWLSGLTPGDVYEILAPYVTEGLPNDLGEVKNKYVLLLTSWYEQYFSKIEDKVISTLEKDAKQKKLLEGTMNAVDLLEQASGGVRIDELDGLDLIILTPATHYAPLTVWYEFNHLYIVKYSVDLPHEDPNVPEKRFMRMTRALADDNRTRILKFLADGPKTFNEILEYSQLAKSTVHHHLMALRGSGLISVYITDESAVGRYRIRQSSFSEFNQMLEEFLQIKINMSSN